MAKKEKSLYEMTPYQLGESRDVEALPHLQSFLSQGTDDEKQSAAKATLKLIREYEDETVDQLLDCFIENLESKSSIVRQAMLKTLIKFELDDEYTPVFTEILKNDQSEFNRKQAAKILTRITGTKVTPPQEKIEENTSRQGRHWSKDEEWHLYQSYCQGMSITKISRLYDRTEKEVKAQLRKLGLTNSFGKKNYPVPPFKSTIREKEYAKPSTLNRKPKPPIQLTEQQDKALKELRDFLDSDKNFYLLKGYAGTGKSTLCCELLKAEQGHKFALTAPTNKAMRVLNSMRIRENLKVKCFTIHSILNLTPKEREGQIVLEQSEDPNLNSWSVIIIDECSMINAELMEIILEIPENYPKMKIIFMGDSAQLPPVGEDISPAFLVPNNSELSEIVRQKSENPILKLTEVLRKQIADESENLPLIQSQSEGDSGIFKATNEASWFKWMQVYFCKDDFKKDNDTFRVVTWSNARVRQINDMIRQAIYGETLAPFTVGEKVLVTAPILMQSKSRHEAVKVLIKTDEECEVLDIISVDICGVPSWNMTIQNEEGEKADAIIPDPKHQHEWEMKEKELKQAALENRKKWPQYYDFIKRFNSVQAPYCMTVHRSQGSTFKHVFVDLPEIQRNPNKLEAAKMLYVAITRCTNSILIW